MTSSLKLFLIWGVWVIGNQGTHKVWPLRAAHHVWKSLSAKTIPRTRWLKSSPKVALKNKVYYLLHFFFSYGPYNRFGFLTCFIRKCDFLRWFLNSVQDLKKREFLWKFLLPHAFNFPASSAPQIVLLAPVFDFGRKNPLVTLPARRINKVSTRNSETKEVL